MAGVYPEVDLYAIASQLGIDLSAALEQLRALYEDVDGRNAANTQQLDLPCHRGCDACCQESVFITPLEFFCVWDWVQQHLDDATRDAVIREGLAVYEREYECIEAFEAAPPAGEADHLSIARELRFRCPLLGEGGQCRVYPVRELYARLFGCSFNEAAGVYGCDLVGAHLAGKVVTLLRVRPQALRLQELPLTFKRQVYPWYLNWLYG